MGRPKKDNSQNVCKQCSVQGKPLTKGVCTKCYQRDHYSNISDDERKRRRASSNQWNKDNRERHNENKRLSYAGISREVLVDDFKCEYCGGGPHFAKGLCVSCYGKKRHAETYSRYRDAKISKQHNISIEAYLTLQEHAAGHCMNCGNEADLVVDHDHSTGRVRGLVCHGCNLLFGHMEKAGPDVVQKAILYLNQNK